jgi:hypothetical protein
MLVQISSLSLFPQEYTRIMGGQTDTKASSSIIEEIIIEEATLLGEEGGLI